MNQGINQQETFVIKIISQQNESWQGTITRVDQNQSKAFRSTLELILLLDSALPNSVKVQR